MRNAELPESESEPRGQGTGGQRAHKKMPIQDSSTQGRRNMHRHLYICSDPALEDGACDSARSSEAQLLGKAELCLRGERSPPNAKLASHRISDSSAKSNGRAKFAQSPDRATSPAYGAAFFSSAPAFFSAGFSAASSGEKDSFNRFTISSVRSFALLV